MADAFSRRLRFAAELARLGVDASLAPDLAHREDRAGRLPADLNLIAAAAERVAATLPASFKESGPGPHQLAAELVQLRDSLTAERKAATPSRPDVAALLAERGFNL